MAADGSIIVDTRVNTGGMNVGVKAISNSFDGLRGTVKKTTQSLAQAFLGGKNLATIFKNIAKFAAAALIGGSLISSIRNLAGSFDLASSSIGDKVKPLSAALETLKGTFVNLILTAFVPMIPHLIAFAQWLTKILITVTQVVAALFGFKKTVGSVMSSAAAGAKKAAKEAKGALAAFDQINLLQKKEGPEGETGAGTTPAPITVPQELLDKVEALKKKVLDFLQPAIELFGKLKKIIVEAWEKLTTWIKDNPEKFRMFLVILGLVVLAFLAVAAVIWLVTTAMTIATAVTGVFAVAIAFLLSPIGLVLLAILALIAIIVLMILNWDKVKLAAKVAWDTIKVIWGIAADFFKTAVVDPIKEGFISALQIIKRTFETTFTGIKSFIKGVINTIIDYINGMIQGVIGGINAVIGAANAIAGLAGLPKISSVSAPQIPRLATGAVIPPNSQFLAVLGDQRSGRNIEAPEGLIRQIVREETGKMQADISIRFEGSLASLVRELKPVIDRENVRVGGSLVKGNVNI